MTPNCSVGQNLDNKETQRSQESQRRLWVFLCRYIEGVGRPQKRLTSQDVAILLTIQWGEEHPEHLLNQAQIASLLGMKQERVSEKLTEKLCQQGFCRPLSDYERQALGIDGNRSNYFRLTLDGRAALEDYARLMFELPSKIREELKLLPEYYVFTRRLNEILTSELPRRFQEVL